MKKIISTVMGAAALVCAPLGLAWADGAAQTATARAIHMPAGDHLKPARAQLGLKAQKLHYTAAFKALKAKGGSAEASGTGTALEAATEAAPAIVRTCTTNSADVFTPSDINGAASKTHIVSVTNDAIGVYRINGCSTLSRLSLEDFVATGFMIPSTQEVFDPRALYDAAHDRFIVTAETFDDINFDQYQYIAMSTDGTASDWKMYQIKLSEGTTKFCKLLVESFWDYPMLGNSNNRLFITANDFPSGQPDEGGEAVPTDPRGAILSIDKLPMLTGAPVTVKCFNNREVNIAAPIVKTSQNYAYFLTPRGTGEGHSIGVFKLVKNSAQAKDDTLSFLTAAAVPAWKFAPNAPQPNGQVLDTLDGRFQAPSVQFGGSIWNVHTVDGGGHARWRLYKFITPSTGMVLQKMIQPSTTTDNSDNLFNPSVDTRGWQATENAWVTFTRTIPSHQNISGNAAMLIAKGPNASTTGWSSTLISNSLDQYIETGFRGGSTTCNNDPSIGTCRWGDYSSTQIDPVDTTRAWGFNQLIIGRTSKNWTTKGSLVK